MSLINRLTGQDMVGSETKIAILPAMAMFGEFQRGAITFNEMVVRFDLNGTEVESLQGWMAAAGAGAFSLEELLDLLVLGESGYYTLDEVKARLGLD